MDYDKPSAENVGDMVQQVSVRYSVNSGIARKTEKEDVGEEPEPDSVMSATSANDQWNLVSTPVGHPWHHTPCTQCLH